MKITHVLWGFTTGGIETMLVNIINHQVQSHHVELVLVNDYYHPSLTEKLSEKCKLVRCRRKIGSKNPIPILRLNSHLLRSHPDIVHLHSKGLSRLIFVPCKMVRTIHNTNNKCDEYPKMKRLFAISKAVQDFTKRQGFESVLVENGIPVSLFVQKKVQWSSTGTLHIVQIGRLYIEQKGQDILINAIKDLVHQHHIQNICVHFIGEGEDCQLLMDIVKENNLDNYFVFEGVKTQQHLMQHLKDYDLLIQPSRYEGFGLTVAEAMATRLPVLVSDIEGPMEIIENGKYGMTFHSNDPGDLASSILQFMNNGVSDDLIEKAHRIVAHKYDISFTAENYLRQYQEVIEQ